MTAEIPSVLARICADKLHHIERAKAATPLATLTQRAKATPAPKGFAKALARAADQGTGLIAEIKRVSPSQGVLRTGVEPAAIAKAYARGGATCLSVLTDEPYFHGSDADLVEARAAVDLPILRKDFMLDPYQVVEARALGADCILVILAAVDDATARLLTGTATEWGMDVLTEVHDEPEMARAAKLGAKLIGVNNRDLRTLKIDLANTERLAPLAPKGVPLVCESGLETSADLERMRRIGIHRFLIGSALMRQGDVATAVAAMIARSPANVGA